MLADLPEFTGEYFCRAERDANGRDEMLVIAEVNSDGREALLPIFEATLKQKIGIEVGVELVGEGETAPLTEIDKRQKPLRLQDNRFN
jgi:phenylacetate-CoA ligase